MRLGVASEADTFLNGRTQPDTGVRIAVLPAALHAAGRTLAQVRARVSSRFGAAMSSDGSRAGTAAARGGVTLRAVTLVSARSSALRSAPRPHGSSEISHAPSITSHCRLGN